MSEFHGYPCSPELAEWLYWYERVLLARHVIRHSIDVFQLKGDYYKSAGVHKDGYAYDIAQMDDESLWVADQMGAFSWPRTSAQGFKPHQHGGLYGIKDMNDGLAGQGRDRKNGWNGLVGAHRARDPRPVSGRDWRQGIEWAKRQLAETSPEPATTSGHLSDRRIDESSWLALSVKYPGYAYTGNDENGPIFVIERATGKTVGSFTIAGAQLKDPESGDVHVNGALWIADLGDNKRERDHIDLHVLAEPGPGHHGPLPAEHYRARYSDGAHNAEAFFLHPITGHRYIITKGEPGALYRNDKGTLDVNAVGKFRRVGSNLPSLVTEAKFSPDGKRVYCRQKGKRDTVTVLDGDTFKTLGSFKVPAVDQPESLDTDGKSVWFGSEGANSPLRKVPIPKDLLPPKDKPAARQVNMTGFKETLPVGSEGHPREVYPIAKFEDAPWFVQHSDHVTFRAHKGGVTTSGSKNVRSELREMDPRSWDARRGRHRLDVDLAVTHLHPGVPVVVAQIHNDADDVTVFRVEGTKLWITNGDNSHGHLVTDKFNLNERHTLGFDVHDGVVHFTFDGKVVDYTVRAAGGNYFKTGCYFQCAKYDIPDSAYAEVDIYDIRRSHD